MSSSLKFVSPRTRCSLLASLVLLCVGSASALQVPARPDQPWVPPTADLTRPSDLRSPAPGATLDPAHKYTLPELIDLAEQHNPDTRVLWQQAKVRAADLRIARSELLPTLAAVATANTYRTGVLFNTSFVRQTVGLFEPVLRVNYTIFDFGERLDRITRARQDLIAAGFAFNTVHLNILFETSRRYYRLLNAAGQQEAAEINLQNALTVQRAVEARLQNGLATLPDALEARSAAAQADFELQAAIGQTQIAQGDLLTLLGVSPLHALQVQPLSELNVPAKIDTDAESAIERALSQRPELARRVAERRSAETSIREARAAYLPTLTFQGEGGEVRAFGQQDQLPSTYAGPLETWNTTLNLRWTLFDGGRREAELARSHADERRAEAEIDVTRDQIEQQVWIAYVDLQTSFRQQQAAATLLAAARTSYQASVTSYTLGLRNTVDVVSAQRTLAQSLSQDVAARTGVLTRLAELAFRTGDLLQSPAARRTP